MAISIRSDSWNTRIELCRTIDSWTQLTEIHVVDPEDLALFALRSGGRYFSDVIRLASVSIHCFSPMIYVKSEKGKPEQSRIWFSHCIRGQFVASYIELRSRLMKIRTFILMRHHYRTIIVEISHSTIWVTNTHLSFILRDSICFILSTPNDLHILKKITPIMAFCIFLRYFPNVTIYVYIMYIINICYT